MPLRIGILLLKQPVLWEYFAVHIAARIQGAAEPGEVLVSSTVKDLAVGSSLRFADRGEHPLKGVPDPWRLYVVVEAPV